MNVSRALLILPALVACGAKGGDTAADPAADCGHDGALAACLSPTQTPEYYAETSSMYFDTMDYTVPLEDWPPYSERVARWEWPPWLLLTAFGRTPMVEGNDALREIDPSTVPVRDCRFFDHQPFARCYVDFDYEVGTGPCAIYEEFTFNEQGEITFIEAWSDLDGMRPQADDDPWAEDDDVVRMAWKLPGLGGPEGRIDVEGSAMTKAAKADPDVADFVAHAMDWEAMWLADLEAAGDDYWDRGCGW